jgi:hypothetical protein
VIPLADLPTTDGVYVLHIDPPLAHAHGYTGWTLDLARRVAEHLDVEACRQAGSHLNADACRRAGGCQHRTHHPGSPLVCAALRSGRSVWVAQIYPGGDRGLERRLHDRHHPRVCVECRSQRGQRGRQLRLFNRARHPAAPALRRVA